jgi:hypothetical protein
MSEASLDVSMPADRRALEPQREYAKAQARDMEGKQTFSEYNHSAYSLILTLNT